jgi:hypothetical protein
MLKIIKKYTKRIWILPTIEAVTHSEIQVNIGYKFV